MEFLGAAILVMPLTCIYDVCFSDPDLNNIFFICTRVCLESSVKHVFAYYISMDFN